MFQEIFVDAFEVIRQDYHTKFHEFLHFLCETNHGIITFHITLSLVQRSLAWNPVENSWKLAWWRHQMETFSALLALCAGNSLVPVNSPHKGQWWGALVISLIYARIKDWVNNREAGDLRRHRGHYDVNVTIHWWGISASGHCRYYYPGTFSSQSITQMILTHWGRVMHICVGKLTWLVQIMACRLACAKPLSEPMLVYC